jgi:hypothetical protein
MKKAKCIHTAGVDLKGNHLRLKDGRLDFDGDIIAYIPYNFCPWCGKDLKNERQKEEITWKSKTPIKGFTLGSKEEEEGKTETKIYYGEDALRFTRQVLRVYSYTFKKGGM